MISTCYSIQINISHLKLVMSYDIKVEKDEEEENNIYIYILNEEITFFYSISISVFLPSFS